MAELIHENIGESLVRVHLVITRGLNVAAERAGAFAQTGFPDVVAESGFVKFLQSLVAVLDGHHLSEDELAFPYFRDRLPKVPYDRLHADHQKIAEILPEIRKAMAETGADGKEMDRVHALLMRVIEMWGPHIGIEEEHFSLDVLARVLEPEEHVKLGKMLTEFSQQHAGPDYLVMPFLLYNLPPLHREAFARQLPPILTNHLVPVVWAEQWAPMKPFLLG
jgi:hemerythrin-like domain-containing protein